MLVPSLTIEVHEDAKKLADAIAACAVSSQVGVASEGEAASYALVWELGNIRQTKKGPKTVRGVNLMTGESAWLSTQAPSGYVRVNEPQFLAFLDRAVEGIDFADLFSGGDAKGELTEALGKVGQSCLELIKATVPVDSGDLQGSLVLLGGDDTDLAEAEGDEAIVSATLT